MPDRRNLVVVAGLILAGGAQLALATEPAAEPRQTLRLDVTVRDLAGLPGNSLHRAERAATHALRGAGIDAIWVDCTPGREEPPCLNPGGRSPVLVSILDKRSSSDFPSPPNVLAMTVLTGDAQSSRTYVLYARVVEVARQSREIDAPMLLGYVAAHEIGHLLLGTHSHSETGIMQPRWFKSDLLQLARRELLFTPSEQRRLHAALLARINQDATR